MDRIQKAADLFDGSCACSQAVLIAFADAVGLDERDASSMASGFGSGMQLGSACGAVTGAIMVLGLALDPPCCADGGDRSAVKAAVAVFAQRFAAAMGSVECPGVLGCDVRTEEGRAEAKARKLYDTVCRDAVREAALILEDMLAERQTGASSSR